MYKIPIEYCLSGNTARLEATDNDEAHAMAGFPFNLCGSGVPAADARVCPNDNCCARKFCVRFAG